MADSSAFDDTQTPADIGAPTALLSQLNWLKASDTDAATEVCEDPLYSDAHITGEFTDGLGPYAFLNTVPLPDGPGVVNAPIVLRAAIHLYEYHPDMSKTDESLYHGGTLVDEIAALASVSLGVRIRGGGETRRFEPGKDPYGRPCAWNDEPKPIVRVRGNRLILPSVVFTALQLDTTRRLHREPQIAVTLALKEPIDRQVPHFQDLRQNPLFRFVQRITVRRGSVNELLQFNRQIDEFFSLVGGDGMCDLHGWLPCRGGDLDL